MASDAGKSVIIPINGDNITAVIIIKGQVNNGKIISFFLFLFAHLNRLLTDFPASDAI